MLPKKLVALFGLVVLQLLISQPLAQGLGVESYFSWVWWYPVNRGQTEGQRVVNWWQKSPDNTFNAYYQGQSVWNYPQTPLYFPESYNGNSIDYYVNWQCGKASEDPFCEDWFVYREIMSQGDGIGDESYLEHWARGGRGLPSSQPVTAWEVYYRPEAFAACDSTTVVATGTAYLQDPAIKTPFVMRLPSEVGIEFVSPVVCTVIFNGYDLQAEQVVHGRTSHWFVVNQILEQIVDENNEVIIKAQNLYFSDHPIGGQDFDSWCAIRQEENYCVLENGIWRSQVREKDGVVGKLFAYEIYWMREVPQANRLANGFGAFQWWTWETDYIEYDDIQVWRVDTCQSEGAQIVCEPPHHLNLPLVIANN